MTTEPAVKYGSDLAVGDMIRTLGEDCLITAMRAYPNPGAFDFMDERWRIAKSGDFGMTIDPDLLWAQLDSGVWVVAHCYPDQGRDFGVPLLRPRPTAAGRMQVTG